MASLKGVQLTLLIGPGAPIPAPREVVEAMISAQVTVASGSRSGFQIVFALSNRSILTRTLIPAGYFDPLMRVILVATVNGLPNVLIDGCITRQDLAASNAPGESRLTITGEDIGHYMNLINLNGFPYPAMPEAARVLVILAKYAWLGVIPIVIPPLFEDIPIPVDKIPAQNGTDLAYIEKLASDNGYVFFIEPGPAPGTNTAYWGPEIRALPPQPALSINMDAASNVENLSFSYDGTAATLHYMFVSVPAVKVAVPVPIPGVSLLKPPMAARPATPHKLELLETAGFSIPRALAIGLGATAKKADPITAQGALNVARYGRALQARRPVGVRGAGLAYDGLWYVKSVTHQLKRGEYKQSFSLSRDGLVSNAPMVPA